MSGEVVMSHKDLSQISCGRFRVGITGLQAAIEDLKSLRDRPDAEIAKALLTRLKSKNYIPLAAVEEYQKAFLREFKKTLGEQAENEPSTLSIKVLGSGCSACDQLEQNAMMALAELGLPASVEHIRDVKEIAALGIFGVPALLINGEVKAVGSVPTKAMLKQWLTEISHQK